MIIGYVDKINGFKEKLLKIFEHCESDGEQEESEEGKQSNIFKFSISDDSKSNSESVWKSKSSKNIIEDVEWSKKVYFRDQQIVKGTTLATIIDLLNEAKQFDLNNIVEVLTKEVDDVIEWKTECMDVLKSEASKKLNDFKTVETLFEEAMNNTVLNYIVSNLDDFQHDDKKWPKWAGTPFDIWEIEVFKVIDTFKSIVEWTKSAEDLIELWENDKADKLSKKNNKKFENMNLDKLKSEYEKISQLVVNLSKENFDKPLYKIAPSTPDFEMIADFQIKAEELKDQDCDDPITPGVIVDSKMIEELEWKSENNSITEQQLLSMKKPVGIDDLLNEKGELKNESIPTPNDMELDLKLDILMKDLRGKTRRKPTTSNSQKQPESSESKGQSTFKAISQPKPRLQNDLFAKFDFWLNFDKVKKLNLKVEEIKEGSNNDGKVLKS